MISQITHFIISRRVCGFLYLHLTAFSPFPESRLFSLQGLFKIRRLLWALEQLLFCVNDLAPVIFNGRWLFKELKQLIGPRRSKEDSKSKSFILEWKDLRIVQITANVSYLSSNNVILAARLSLAALASVSTNLDMQSRSNSFNVFTVSNMNRSTKSTKKRISERKHFFTTL